MKKFAQRNFNRHHIIDILDQLSSPSTRICLAVNIMESMQITSVYEAIEDKLSIYDDYVNNRLKYSNCLPVIRIENIMKSFLIEHSPMAYELFRNNTEISVVELIESCSFKYPVEVTTAKCIFYFLYIVSTMKRIMHPAVKMSFLPYDIENFIGIDKFPLLENEFFLYFKLDMHKKFDIMNAVMGACNVLLCLVDETGKIEYCIHMTDELSSMDEICYILDYVEKKDTLRVLNSIGKDNATSFYQVNNSNHTNDILENLNLNI